MSLKDDDEGSFSRAGSISTRVEVDIPTNNILENHDPAPSEGWSTLDDASSLDRGFDLTSLNGSTQKTCDTSSKEELCETSSPPDPNSNNSSETKFDPTDSPTCVAEQEILASKPIEEAPSNEGVVSTNENGGSLPSAFLSNDNEDDVGGIFAWKEPVETPNDNNHDSEDDNAGLVEFPYGDDSDEDGDSLERCPICFDVLCQDIEAATLAESENMAATVEECKHVFCSVCLAASIRSNIKIRKVPSPCPMPDCSACLSTELVETLLLQGEVQDDKKLLAKYKRLEKLHKDPSLVECTKCEGVFKPEKKENLTGLLSCTHCGHSFCKEHGDSHAGMSCKKWLTTTTDGRAFRKTEKRMKRLTKPCPHCSLQIQKDKGCNHMHCAHCNKDWCWACGGGDWESGHTCPPPMILRPCLCMCSEHIRGKILSCLGCSGEVLLIGSIILAFLLASLFWAALGMALALMSVCFFCGYCCWNSEKWGDWNLKKGLLLCLVLVFFPIADACFERAVDNKFPGLTDRVDVIISNVLSAVRACFRHCFRTDFPVMRVANRGAGINNSMGAKVEQKINNNSTSETMPRISEEEYTV